MSDSFSGEGLGQPCANPDCSFSGHAGFENYCSVCYKLQLNKPSEESKEESNKMETEEVKATEFKAVGGTKADESPKKAEAEAEATIAATGAGGAEEPALEKKIQKNRKRCFDCRKKVGYTGFECRCGFVFCGSHRMPEDHACEFDHKAHGLANLANAAHKVEAKKLDVL